MIGKELYIWNVNRDAADVFLSLAFRLIDIQGFVVIDAAYDGTTLLGKPVLHLSGLCGHEDAILIFGDMAVSICDVDLPEGVTAIQYSALLRCHRDLTKKQIYLYHADRNSQSDGKLAQWLDGQGICYHFLAEKGICRLVPGDAVVVGGLTAASKDAALSKLADAPCDVYVDSIVPLAVRSCDCFALTLDAAIKNERKIVLCGRRDLISEMVRQVFEHCGFPIAGQVYLEADLANGIEDMYSLMYEDLEQITIIVNEGDDRLRGDLLKQLFDMGCSAEGSQIIGIQTYTYSDKYLRKEIFHVDDMLLWYSLADKWHELNGWQILGEPEKAERRVIILGGSTSMEGVYWTESWSKKLFRRLNDSATNTAVFLGVHPGQAVTGEFLRLIRDGHHIKPDIVISMSGANDTLNTLINRFNPVMTNQERAYSIYSAKICSGIPTGESNYDFWLRIENLMKFHVEQQLGARFFSFLQPLNMYMEDMSLSEKIQFEAEAHSKGCRNFYEQATDEDIYINLIDLFHHRENMYFDVAHYTDEANEILADRVLAMIMK